MKLVLEDPRVLHTCAHAAISVCDDTDGADNGEAIHIHEIGISRSVRKLVCYKTRAARGEVSGVARAGAHSRCGRRRGSMEARGLRTSTDNLRWCGCVACEAREGGGAAHAGEGQPLWRVALGEATGAALLVLLTCAAVCAPSAADSLLQRTVASGLVVTLLVQCFDHVSGAQFNPTVTLAALVWGRVSWLRAGVEAAAQLAGGALGAGVLCALRPAGAACCVTRPALDACAAACVEALLGGCLALANCAAWDPRNAGLRDSWPLRVGLSVAGLSLVGGELTGASMNPVRSFGPALWSGDWTSHWVYWVGPLGGSALFTSAYVLLWRPHRPRRRDLKLRLSEPALAASAAAAMTDAPACRALP
ncbi:hypothetical protein PYW08_004158 [Mythimna loreyi]|uniref:Uncharacterized protein n=1 Tax=Mythimna loreyi TaxID=667449 RepID=A0ACC2QXB1_9NEOP|nr:hypothetical protein PYW08_004158 [Mythimna loreyi]